MDEFRYATISNIKRLENLLATSDDDAERRMIVRLLAKEKDKIALPESAWEID